MDAVQDYEPPNNRQSWYTRGQASLGFKLYSPPPTAPPQAPPAPPRIPPPFQPPPPAPPCRERDAGDTILSFSADVT
eukprot:2053288-Prymnesium_polylepis.1